MPYRRRRGPNFEISGGGPHGPHQALNEMTVDNALYPKSSVRRPLLDGCQSAVKVQPTSVQIMLTTADSAQVWPGRNT
jgi:hypothetical protein